VVKLPAKESRVVFGNLPDDIDVSSLSVSSDRADILSCDFKTTYLKEPTVAPRIEEIDKKLEKAKEDLDLTESKIAVLDFEKETLVANRMLNTEKGVKVDELKGATDFLRKTFEKNRLDMLKLQRQRKEQQLTIEKLSRELKGGLDTFKSVGEVTCEVNIKAAGEAKLILTYYSRKASWSHFYEARARDGDNTIELKLKAKIAQQTGEDWTDIKLYLATSRPNTSLAQPSLDTWFLRPTPPPKPTPSVADLSRRVERVKKKESRRPSTPEEYELEMIREELEMERAALSTSLQMSKMSEEDLYFFEEEDKFTVLESLSGLEFELNDTVSLPSNESKSFEVVAHKLQATFSHSAIPKLEKDVFLVAIIEDWKKLGLIEGNISVFYNNAFVGKTYLHTYASLDSIIISFGRDKSVIVKRTKSKEFTGTKLFGNNSKTQIAFTIDIKNTKKSEINLRLKDQVPVSTDKTITVDVENVSGAIHSKATGELFWALPSIKPGESLQKSFKYSVTHPVSDRIALE